ncbi:MAG: cytidylate kinase family protein [Lachnospiraceae bacterium]|nr:cytidylate kinase family protein [Lachnospiraceae bacterium]
MMDFFLYAPLEYRISHIRESYELDLLQAEKLIKRVVQQRHNYYKYVTGKNRGDRYDKHLMIDVSKFKEEGTVALMKEALQRAFGR